MAAHLDETFVGEHLASRGGRAASHQPAAALHNALSVLSYKAAPVPLGCLVCTPMLPSKPPTLPALATVRSRPVHHCDGHRAQLPAAQVRPLRRGGAAPAGLLCMQERQILLQDLSGT